jgi:hypothetical protein
LFPSQDTTNRYWKERSLSHRPHNGGPHSVVRPSQNVDRPLGFVARDRQHHRSFIGNMQRIKAE